MFGARNGHRAPRWRRDDGRTAEDTGDGWRRRVPTPSVELGGARYGPDNLRRYEPEHLWREADGPDLDGGYDGQPEDPAADRNTLVRPYIRTGGRTRGPANLGIETLVSVNPGRPPGGRLALEPDYRLVVELCAAPKSVAEVAALASLPLGVARVLIADLARVGVIRVHKNAAASDGKPGLALMERVLAGLHRL